MHEAAELPGAGTLELIEIAVADRLGKRKVPDDEAARIGQACKEAVRAKLGGQHVHVSLSQAWRADPAAAKSPHGTLERLVFETVAKALAGQAEHPEVIASACVSAVQRAIGGVNLYIAKGDAALRGARDERIWRDFTGANYRELASRYDLSVMRIRQIVNAVRARRKQARPVETNESTARDVGDLK